MRRALLVGAVAVALLGAVAAFAVASRGDIRTEVVEVPAPRGRILDRHGTVLAVDRTDTGPGTDTDTGPAGPARTYPYGDLMAHVLHDVEQRPEVAGTPGRIVYEVDEGGTPIRERTEERVAPVPGRDVTLTLDVDLQHVVEEALAAEVARRTGVVDDGCYLVDEGGDPTGCDPQSAASVVLAPTTGEVLALASYPGFDLDGGGPPTPDAALVASPPASTIKPFTAHGGLVAGLITPTTVHQDTGLYRYHPDCAVDGPEGAGCSARNPGGTANGPVDLRDALAVSSDTYWYSLADRSWRDRADLGEEVLQEAVGAWGFGAPTGIDLEDEDPGAVPTPSDGTGDAVWTSATSGALAVGQGGVRATPLQVAVAYGGLATGGVLRTPHVVVDAPGDGREVDLPPEWADALRGGLDDAVARGTAAIGFAGHDLAACPVAGKTGTAQEDGRNDTSWFAATSGDRLAMATVVDGAGYGARAAVPVTRRVADAVAAAGCDPTAIGTVDPAPAGGAIDVDAALAAFVPDTATASPS